MRRLQFESAAVPGTLKRSLRAEEVGDHDHRHPRFTAKERGHDRLVKAALEIVRLSRRADSSELRDPRQIALRLLARGVFLLERLLPNRAQRLVIVGRIGRDGESLILAARRRSGRPNTFPNVES